MKKTILLSLMVLGAIHTQGQTLKLNLEKGETYSQSSDAEVFISQVMGGQTMEITMNVMGRMSYTVKDKLEDHYWLDVTYKSIGLKTVSPYMTMDYSSEKATDDDPMSKAMSKMIGKTFEVKMGMDGSVMEVKNIDQLFDDIFEDNAEITDMQKAQMMEQMKQSYGEDTFRSSVEMITSVFPEGDVSVGDSWNSKREFKAGMQLLMDNEYTLTELTDDFAVIEINASSTTLEGTDFENMNGMPAKYNMNGTMGGTIKVDRRTGWIETGSFSQKFEGSIEIGDNPQVPGGMSIPMEMRSETKLANK